MNALQTPVTKFTTLPLTVSQHYMIGLKTKNT